VRVVVDTNVWVSAVLNPAGFPGRVLSAFEERQFTLITSEYLLDELRRVLARPRLVRKHRRSPEWIERFTRALGEGAECVTLPASSGFDTCRDPKDSAIVDTALHGNARALVTRDDDLKGDSDLVVALHALGLEVLTIARFLRELDEEAALGRQVD
jgi:putative PIN family toxin of toxin-antitoxin system